MRTSDQRLVLFLVSGAGVGYLPRIPGTFGTLVAIPLAIGLNRIATDSLFLAALTLIGSICCAVWLSGKGAEILQQKDPGLIVIDEIVGFLVAYFIVPLSAESLLIAFFLFRFFDIAKIFPISTLEKLSGGLGIVLDDVMAGIYTVVILRLLFAWSIL